jgi:hypothetical protein
MSQDITVTLSQVDPLITSVTLVEDDFPVQVGYDSNDVIPGPTGPPGGSMEATKYTLPCGENISGGNAVMVVDGKLYKLNVLNPAHSGRLFGIARQAGVVNDEVEVITSGICILSGWGLVPDSKQFVKTDSQIGSTPPVVGDVVSVGVSLSSDKLQVNINQPIEII